MFYYILRNDKIRALYCIVRYIIYAKLLKNYKFLNNDVIVEESFIKKKILIFQKTII